MIVKLTYFKPETGKYYAEGEMHMDKDRALYKIFQDVEDAWEARILPGLQPMHSAFIVHINAQGHPHSHPHILVPGPDYGLKAQAWEELDPNELIEIPTFGNLKGV